MSPDDLDLMQLARTGDLLATVDNVEYHAVQLVFAWSSGGVPSLYCQYQDWLATHAAKLATKEREIAELAQTLEHWAAEATEQARRASAAEQRVKELERQLAAEQPSADPGPCPDCGKAGWKSSAALQMHRQRAHQGMQTPKQSRMADDQGWRCAVKGCTGAFTRSLTDPDHCTQHAAPHTNGVEALAPRGAP